jgi:hypothetical protein
MPLVIPDAVSLMGWPRRARAVGWRLGFMVLAGALALGCNGSMEEPARPVPEGARADPAVFGEHRFDESLKAGLKPAGQDCTAGGRGECESGLCLHTGTEPGEGYVCSKTCQTLTDCPADWRCAQVQPGAATRVCIPPAS